MAGPTNGRKARRPLRSPASVARPAERARSVTSWGRAAASFIRDPCGRGDEIPTYLIANNLQLQNWRSLGRWAEDRAILFPLPALPVLGLPAELVDFWEAFRGKAAGV